MDKAQFLNPFNLIVHIVFFFYNIYKEIMTAVMNLWQLACVVLIGWLIVALVIPGIDYAEHLTMLFNNIIVDPAIFLIHYFSDLTETVRVEWLIPEENFLKHAWFLFLWAFLNLVTLAVAPVIWFGWIINAYLGFWRTLSGEAEAMFMGASMGASGSAGMRNLGHLIMGRVSIKEMYDNDAKANSIVEAFERKHMDR